jgi:hypothetical protein
MAAGAVGSVLGGLIAFAAHDPLFAMTGSPVKAGLELAIGGFSLCVDPTTRGLKSYN